MSIFQMIDYIKGFYPTLRGRAWEDVPDNQIIAIYHSLVNRAHKKPAVTRYKAPKSTGNQLTFIH